MLLTCSLTISSGSSAGWAEQRYYIVANDPERPRFEKLVGGEHLITVADSGGKMLLTNHPVH